jgi:hypothetical protein
MIQARVAPAPPAAAVEVVLATERDGITVAEGRRPSAGGLVAVRHGNQSAARPQLRLGTGDAVLLFGPPGLVDQVRQQLGRVKPGTWPFEARWISA